MVATVILGLIALFILLAITGSIFTVRQNTVVVITRFGKYRRIAYPGLNVKTPFLDSIFTKVSLQNQAIELEFQAITVDQANVYFKTMILYSVLNSTEETIKNVAFKFVSTRDFIVALTKSLEGSVRAFVATKKQEEVLALRREIVDHVKEQMDDILAGWGYHLQDIQINDVTFDKIILESMAKVVASNNLKAAAINEGDANYIKKKKDAEAEGIFITIQAESNLKASELNGKAVAAYREQITVGLAEAQDKLGQGPEGMIPILFGMYMETMRQVAENGKGNMIFFDGSTDNMSKILRQFQALLAQEKINE